MEVESRALNSRRSTPAFPLKKIMLVCPKLFPPGHAVLCCHAEAAAQSAPTDLHCCWRQPRLCWWHHYHGGKLQLKAGLWVWEGGSGGRKNQHRIWKISQSAHLTLQQTSEDEDQGGIKMTKLDLFTVGKLHTVSLCKKSAHYSLCYSMGKNLYIHMILHLLWF